MVVLGRHPARAEDADLWVWEPEHAEDLEAEPEEQAVDDDDAMEPGETEAIAQAREALQATIDTATIALNRIWRESIGELRRSSMIGGR